MMNPDMINPMMMLQNNGMMMNPDMINPMMMFPNNGMMINQMMMQNMINRMNNGMMTPVPNFNNNMDMNRFGINNMMINQNKEDNLDIFFHKDEYIGSISKDIFSENDSWKKVENKLMLIYFNLKKKIYRTPSPTEVILRESSKETLEYLLERGVIEDQPNIDIFCNNLRFYGWKDIGFMKYNNLSYKDLTITKVSFDGHLRGAGCLTGLEFVNLEGTSNTKVLRLSKNTPKWRKISEGLNLFGKCTYGKCPAYQKEVIHIVGINKSFDFDKQKKKYFVQFAIKILSQKL